MQKILIVILLIISLTKNYSQELVSDFICGTSINLDSLCGSFTPAGLENNLGVVQGGRLKTAQGVLKVLLVYARFSDDNYNDNPYWPNPGILPQFLQNSVNSSIPSNNIYADLNVSNFIDRASGGNGAGKLGVFQMIGDVFYVTLPNTKEYYRTHGGDGAVNYAVLSALDNPAGNFNLNFRNYDNWQFRVSNQNYRHNYVPYNPGTNTGGDAYIDHVFIFWRDKSFSYPNAGGYAGLGLPSNFTTNDGVTIRSEDGTTQVNAKNLSPSTDGQISFGGVIHEYGHFMFGTTNSNTGSHFDGRSYYNFADDNNGNIHPWSLMVLISAGNINSYERYRLKWLSPTVITSSNSDFVLKDTYIENKAVMIPIRYNSNNKPVEFYWIENFHSIAHYSNANPFSLISRFGHIFPHGLVIFHIRDESVEFPTLSNLDIECADGLWNWDLTNGSMTPNDRSDDQIDRIIVNRTSSGLDEKDWIPLLTYNDYRALKPSSCINCNPQHGWRYYSDDWLGDEQDIWNLQNNNVFSRFSNPGTYIYGGNPVELGIEIKSYNSITHEYTLNIQFGNYNVINLLSPSKPQNPKLSSNPGNHFVRLSWENNLETDKVYYEVSRKVTELGGTWQVIGTTTNNYFVDNEYYYSNPVGDFGCTYRLRVKDTQNKFSVYSDEVFIRAEFMGKIAVTNEAVKVYKLDLNYPNPFNPSTIINYAVKDAGLVKLKVFDILGSEVAELVNEVKEAGYHSVEFNASALPSGVYIYTMQAGSFVSSKKMILMK